MSTFFVASMVVAPAHSICSTIDDVALLWVSVGINIAAPLTEDYYLSVQVFAYMKLVCRITRSFTVDSSISWAE